MAADTARILVLAALIGRESVCMHVLLERTGLPKEVLLPTLSGLVGERVLRKVKTEYGDVYTRTPIEVEIDSELGMDSEHLPMLNGLTIDEARTRVHMLTFMKNRLINEWHPIIDKLIGDYERGLKIVEGLRYGSGDELSNLPWQVEKDDD